MSHPNPSHDRENEYRTDFKTSVHKKIASKMRGPRETTEMKRVKKLSKSTGQSTADIIKFLGE